MAYARFLYSLFEDGRLRMPQYAELTAKEIADGDAVIAEYERAHRLEMPRVAPDLAPAAARWAGVCFFRACQFTVLRDIGEPRIRKELGSTFPHADEPIVHYSVDLVFRYLPDLWRFARSGAEQDPLLEHLVQWSRDWPLSSVGVPGVDEVSIDGFASSPSLLQLYVDRVIAAADERRLRDVRVRRAAQAALGMYPHLNPRLSQLLLQETDS